MHSHSAPFLECGKTRTPEKPTRPYTLICAAIEAATESVNALGAKRARPRCLPSARGRCSKPPWSPRYHLGTTTSLLAP
jgi:hypothetical protein